MNLLQYDLQVIIPRLAWTLVQSLWQGGIVAVALLVLMRFTSQNATKLRYVISCTAMALIPLAAVVTYISTGSQTQFATVKISAAPQSVVPPAANMLPLHTSPSSPSAVVNHEQLLQAIVMLWAAGVLIFTLRHLLGWISLQRLKQGNHILALDPTMTRLCQLLRVRKTVRLIETKRLGVPAVVGAFRPIILLPAGLLNEISPQQIEAILLHELAHVTRYDYLANLIQVTIESLMFYHPAIWWISSQIRQEREHCCDDIAVAHCTNAKAYATALLALEEHRLPPVFPAPAATGGNLLHRVRRLLEFSANPQRQPARSVVTAFLVAVCLILPFVVLAQQKPTTTPTTTAVAELAVPSEILPEDLVVKEVPYRLGNQDLLEVSIENLTGQGIETTKDARVDSNGKVRLPLLGDVPIAGFTIVEAEQSVAKAYGIKNLFGKGGELTVSINVAEMRGRTFSIMGQVAHPGQYAITNPIFHVSAAIALAGDVLKKEDRVFVMRAASPNGSKRTLTIPLEKIKAGDLSVDVVIRRGDTLLVTDQYSYLDVVIDETRCLFDKKSIDLTELEKLIAAVPAFAHPMTVIRLSAASPAVTDERMLVVVRQMLNLVKKYGLAAVDDTEISRRKKTVDPNSQTGEYYISGQVPRAGVYSLSGRKITLKQAIVSAGADDADTTDYYLSIIRRDGDKESWPFVNVRYSDLFSGAQPDIYLHPNDIVSVHKNAWPTTKNATTESTIIK